MRISSGCVETVALYEVDLPEELVRVLITNVNFFLIEHITGGSGGIREKGRGRK